MRIAIDGRTFDASAGGVRRYATELFAAIRAVAPATELVAIGGTAVPPGIPVRKVRASLPTNLGWCASGLPAGAARETFDVFHAPAYTAPLWGARPLVVSIHDVSYARQPGWSPHPGGVGTARQWFYGRSARRADRIVTASCFSKQEIIAAYGIDEGRIDVVPLGVGPVFRPDPAVRRERVVLHVGDLHPRRNLGLLVDAVVALAGSNPALADLRLVLIGRDLGSLDGLHQRARASGRPDRVMHIAHQSEEDLVRWYQRAAVMAYPSRYEGFGLPVVEAMACGTPVVASHAASIPEVTGTAAVLLSPEDPDGWREAIERVLGDAVHARTLSEQGEMRAAAFTWERTAALTLESYTLAMRPARA